MFIVRATLITVGAVFLIASTAAFSPQGPGLSYAATCTGTGRSVPEPSPQNPGPTPGMSSLELDCVGGCSTGDCSEQHAFGGGLGGYRYCGCDGEDEPACCHLIITYDNNGEPVFRVRGDCPSCHASGVCRLETNDGTTQAACMTSTSSSSGR